MTLELNGQSLHPKQDEIAMQMYSNNTKYNNCICGRNFGKTVLLREGVFFHATYEKCKIYVISANFGVLSEIFSSIIEVLSESGWIYSSVKGHAMILINGSSIEFYSYDKPEGLRGHNFANYIFFDEAAKLADWAWDYIVQQICYTPKKVYTFSTPRGKNWYYKFCQRASSDPYNFVNFKGTTFDNPYIPTFEKENIMSHEGTDLFRQEALAEFIESGGEVFNNIDSLFVLDEYARSENNTGGIDFARENDYTTIWILNKRKELVYHESFTGLDFDYIDERCKHAMKKYNCRFFGEKNNIGAPTIERLHKQGYKKQIIEFNTTSSSKSPLIQGLRYTLQHKEMKLLKLKDNRAMEKIKSELESYEYKLLPSGQVGYSAPKGLHDDEVMGGALAIHSWNYFNNRKETSFKSV